MSATSNAALFRWDDTRYAASHALRSYLRSILPHKEWNQEFEVQSLANVGLGSDPVLGPCRVDVRHATWTRLGRAPLVTQPVSTSAHVYREWLQLLGEIVAAHGAAPGPMRAGLIPRNDWRS